MRNNPLKNLCRISLLASACCIVACSSTDTKNSTATPPTYERLNAVLWIQTSAEYYALTQSAYTQATSMLGRGLADKKWTAAQEQTGDYQNLPPAIILDIDETVLDNSPFQAQLIKDNAIFTQEAWCWPTAPNATPMRSTRKTAGR